MYITKRKVLTLTTVLAIVLSFAPARAVFATCTLSGTNGTFKVGKLILPEAANLGIAWRHNDPVQVPFTDDKGYYTVSGLYIVNAYTHYVPAWATDMGAGGAPRAAVEVNGTTYVNSQIPSTRASGSHGGIDAYKPPALGGGTWWVVGYGYGASQGATGPGTWTVTVSAGAACPEVSVPGELQNFNQADFSGGTQVFAPGVGVGSNLKLNRTISRNTVLGSLCAENLLGNIPGTMMDLGYSYPVGHSGHLGTGDGFRAMMGTFGTYSFTANYRAADPLININFVSLDLPSP